MDCITRGARHYLESHRPVRVISGMAQGWDTAIAEAAVQLGIALTAAVPFPGQEAKWPVAAQVQYQTLLALADRVETIGGGFSLAAYQARNEWMVDHSNRVVALWNGTWGGTANCVKYAQHVGRPVDNLWADFAAARGLAA